MAQILLIDDDAAGRRMAAYNLKKSGHVVDEAESGESGLERFDPTAHDLVITDVRMPGLSGIELVERLRGAGHLAPILVITAYGDVETAVAAMKAGAFEFLLKPFSRDQLLVIVDRALEFRRMERENLSLRRKLRGVERPIISQSAAMQVTLDLADRAATSDASVLVSGESGTGKELIARRLHARSGRAEGPFVAINCAAMPEELLEAELFGVEKGAFTGASRARRGRFRQADGGTLFLDEIGELPLSAQGKLLRVLQEHVVDVVGSDTPVPVDVRLVAATNRDLQAEIGAGRFRQDLYFRLAVFEINVPPLRDRPDDIPVLARHFLRAASSQEDLDVPQAVLDDLKGRPWIGNVRELENACERLLVLSPPSGLTSDVLPPLPGTAPTSSDPRTGDLRPGETPQGLGDGLMLPPEGLSLLDLERRVIERALAQNNDNISETARYLRVPRHFLVYRIDKYGIPRPRQR